MHNADIVGLGRAPTNPTIVYSDGVQGSRVTMHFQLDIRRPASHYWHQDFSQGSKEAKCFWQDAVSMSIVTRRTYEARFRIGRDR